MAHSNKRIGLLGGSFDPVHNGHVSIAASFLDTELIDELWILLTPDPPHKADRALTDYQTRFEMLQAAFKDVDQVQVTDIEKELPSPSYTIQTLQYLSKKYPDYDFFLCLGGDSLKNFQKWKDWRKLLDYCQLLVARRPNNGIKISEGKIKQNTHFVEHEPIEISSTMVRKNLLKGADISKWVPQEVLKIIKREKLYT